MLGAGVSVVYGLRGGCCGPTLAAMPRRTRASADKPTKPEPSPAVTKRKPDPLAWKIALEAAGGDARRLRVIDPTTIEVLNHPQ